MRKLPEQGAQMDLVVRQALTIVRDTLVTAESRLFSELSATFRWLMATLFTGNGGAVVALMGADRPPPGADYAQAWFSCGMLCSILMGALSCFSVMRHLMPMVQIRLKIEEGLIGESVPEAELQNYIDKTKTTWKTWAPSYFGVASLAFLTIGIATVAGSIIRAAV